MDTLIDYWKTKATTGYVNHMICNTRCQPTMQGASGEAQGGAEDEEMRDWYEPSNEGIDEGA